MTQIGTAVVTGGSGGIGMACAKVLRDRGYDVLLTSRRQEPLERAAIQLGVRHYACDCSDEEQVSALAAQVDQVAMLVHAAGILEGRPMREQTVETFDRVMNANFRSAYVTTSALLPQAAAGSRFVFVSSVAGQGGMAGLTAYSSSKGALGVFARTLAKEVEAHGINVHLITPAPVDTAMLDDAQLALNVLEPEDIASALGWIESLPPHVVVREIVMRAATRGPYAGRVVGGPHTEEPGA